MNSKYKISSWSSASASHRHSSTIHQCLPYSSLSLPLAGWLAMHIVSASTTLCRSPCAKWLCNNSNTRDRDVDRVVAAGHRPDELSCNSGITISVFYFEKRAKVCQWTWATEWTRISSSSTTTIRQASERTNEATSNVVDRFSKFTIMVIPQTRLYVGKPLFAWLPGWLTLTR